MRIGLIRHFPVKHGFPEGWRTSAELGVWQEAYDRSEVLVGAADLGEGGWKQCLASDLPRAQATAAAVFEGRVELTPLLREARFEPVGTGGLRLPIWAWRIVLQISWTAGHSSQRACRDDFRRRVQAAADRIESAPTDLLVVSHAGMMASLSAELRRRGFDGPGLRLARHATVYTYRRRV